MNTYLHVLLEVLHWLDSDFLTLNEVIVFGPLDKVGVLLDQIWTIPAEFSSSPD